MRKKRKKRNRVSQDDLTSIWEYCQTNYSGYFEKTFLIPLKNIKNNFNFAIFLIFCLGIFLIAINFQLYIGSLSLVGDVYSFVDYIKFGILGLIGIIISCYLLIACSISYAGNPYELKKTFKKERRIRAKGKVLALSVLIYLALSSVGILLLVICQNEKEKTAHYLEVEGQIIELISSKNSNGDIVYKHIYQYQVSGIIYQFHENRGRSGTAVGKIGDIVLLKYDPTDPNKVMSASFNQVYQVISIIILIIIVGSILYQLGHYQVITTGIFSCFILFGFPTIVILMIGGFDSGLSIYQLLFKHPWLFIFITIYNLGIIMVGSALINKLFNNQNVNNIQEKH